jgi:Domain of unknown function (DUF1848)
MIISASYKTDIPAFYGAWFMERLQAGYCLMKQPYNGRTLRVSLMREDVDGYVFWTKNLGPFLKYLPEVRAMDHPFVVQYTINGYPRRLESIVVPPQRSIEQMHRLAGDFGPRVGVWRYDPILLTSATGIDFHRRNFETLAQSLSGATDEVIISFAQFYRKTKTNLRRAAGLTELDWQDPSAQIKQALAAELTAIAAVHRMRLSLCAQPEYRSACSGEARCIDADRLAAIADRAIPAKLKGNRPHCACHASRDIGEYDTCPHGCMYCYAVRDHAAAAQRHKDHDPHGEFLFSPH